MWHCGALRKGREEADSEIASIDPHQVHPATRHGVAPAMSPRLKGSYWGSDQEDTSHATKKLLGNVPEGMTPSKIRHRTNKREAIWTAREVIQHYTSSWKNEDISKPKKLEDGIEAPDEPNGYSDGSLKKPIGNHRAIWGHRSLVAEPQRGA